MSESNESQTPLGFDLCVDGWASAWCASYFDAKKELDEHVSGKAVDE